MCDTFIRNVEVETLGDGETVLSIHQEKVGDVGAVVWDAALVLSYYLQMKKARKYTDGKRIIELGAGTGVVGLVASVCGAEEVLLTDLPSFIPLLRKNIDENKGKLCGKVEAVQLPWGTELSPALRSFQADCILIADCVYYESAVRPLAQSIADILLSCNPSVALCCYEDRDTSNKEELQTEFRRILVEEFSMTIQYVPFDDLHPDFRSNDIHIFKISPNTRKGECLGPT